MELMHVCLYCEIFNTGKGKSGRSVSATKTYHIIAYWQRVNETKREKHSNEGYRGKERGEEGGERHRGRMRCEIEKKKGGEGSH